MYQFRGGTVEPIDPIKGSAATRMLKAFESLISMKANSRREKLGRLLVTPEQCGGGKRST